MSAHTPGPWAIQMAEDCQGRQLDEMVRWAVTADANHLWVSTGPTWDAEHHAESIANARLIAAAPDLLFELRDLRERFHSALVHGGTDPEYAAHACAKADAAIANATHPFALSPPNRPASCAHPSRWN